MNKLFEIKSTVEANLSECSHEPIHIPGSIQPHGILLALKEPDLTIVQVSKNIEEFSDLTSQTLLPGSLEMLIGKMQADFFKEQVNSRDLKELNPLACTISKQDKRCVFDVTAHRSEGLLIFELEPAIARNEQYINNFFYQGQNLVRAFGATQDIAELFNLAAKEIKRITNFDRVMVYQFKERGEGEVIAEAKQSHLETFLGLHYPASDIPLQARELYLRNWLRLIPDIDYKPAPLNPPFNPLTQKPLDLTFSVLRSVSPIHIEYLRNMRVRASMSISLIHDNKLWGLIACHHNSPKFLPYELRATCEYLGHILSWQLTNTLAKISYEQLANRRKYVTTILESISAAENWIKGLLTQEKPLLELVNAEGAAISYNNAYYLLGKTPSVEETKDLIDHVKPFLKEEVFFTDCLAGIYPNAEKLKTVVSGVMVVTINKDKNNFILWFRPEVIQTVKWAGDPEKSLMKGALAEQLRPRKSFALWKEEMRLKSTPWKVAEQQAVEEFKRFMLETIIKYESNRTEDAIAQKKRQEEFTDIICHEIRNPIHAILGSLTLIRDQLEKITITQPTLSEQMTDISKNVDDITACVKYQETITNQVLDLSRSALSTIKVEKKLFDLIETIQMATKMFAGKITAKGLQLKFKLPKKNLFVKGDPQLLKQIITNLIANAVKFTDKGSIILSLQELTTTATHQKIRITVEDTGIGMTELEKNRLFERYSQANEQIASQYGGSGLGLFISRKFAEMMGGNMEVTSEKNVGSKFSISIPFEQFTEEEKNTLQDRKSVTSNIKALRFLPASGNKKVLVVDDNAINQKILNSYLKKGGYEVEIASNGKIAVEMFLKSKFDAIIMDIEMPVMNGYEATKLIRQKEKELEIASVPIICLSGNAREEYERRAMEVGMNDFITKPIHREEILATLGKFLSTTGVFATLKENKADKANGQWYTDKTIKQLLEKKLENRALIKPLLPMQSEPFQETFKKAIEEIGSSTIAMPMVFPIQIHGNHWVGLVIKKVKNEPLQVIYNDPMGNALQNEPQIVDIVNLITQVDAKADIFDLQWKQQANDDDCGPFTVENLAILATTSTAGMDKNKLCAILPKGTTGPANELRHAHHTLLTNPASQALISPSLNIS